MIVSDVSTEGTDAIVNIYTAEHRWIELLRMPERKERHFADKEMAFNTDWAKIKYLAYDVIGVIGSLDVDVSFGPDYFEYLLEQCMSDPLLGVAGTTLRDRESQYDYRFSRKKHISDTCYIFRRSRFEEFGGYTPLKGGAIDLVAVVTTRMKGWKTETFMDRTSVHHRPIGSAANPVVAASLKSGYGDFRICLHPVCQVLRSLYQINRKPYLVSGFALLAVFMWAKLRCTTKPVSREFVRFRRREQMAWLMEYVERVL